MQLRLSFLLSALASTASALQLGGIDVNSQLGSKLLASARRLNDQDGRDFTWAAGYSIRFKSCHTITTLPAGECNKNDGQGLVNNDVVVFQLCPSGTCGTDTCANGAEYAIAMNYFLGAYTKARMEREQQICQNIRENCYCDNANDDQACENQCYLDKGADYCVQYEGEEKFEIQRYLQDDWCQEMGNRNNNNDGNNQGYYIGAYCASTGDAVYLGVFDDASCVNRVEDGLYLYEKYNYRSLPYSKESLVGYDCVSCEEVDENQNNNNNNNNNNQEARVIKMCELMYQGSAKCETNLVVSSYGQNNNSNNQYWYPDEKACNYINNVLPRLDQVFGTKNSRVSMKSDN